MAHYGERDLKKALVTKRLNKTKEPRVDREPWEYYKADVLNYQGKMTADTYYGEVLAKLILKEGMLAKISKSVKKKLPPRGGNYKQASHDGSFFSKNPTKLTEKRMAVALYNKFKKERMGEFELLDYQTPLKKPQTTDARGEIDLLAYDGKNLCLIELKPPESKETVLRAALEAYTYGEIIKQDFAQICADFNVVADGIRKIVLMSQSSIEGIGGLESQYDLFKKVNIEIYSYAAETLDGVLTLSNVPDSNKITPTWAGDFRLFSLSI